MVIVTELLLYLCFSILLGSIILRIVPSTKVPIVKIPKTVVLVAILGIPLFSFFPILKIILHLHEGIGFWVTLQSVVLTFDIGQAWIFTVIFAYILFFLVLFGDFQRVKELPYFGLFLVFLLILALGWSSHAASMYSWPGFILHTIHFLAVTVWLGVLFVVSWWSKDKSHWDAFLKWYHPLATICLLLVIFSGISLMSLIEIIENYSSSWMLPYGQSLLIKHILIIPVLAFAIINGFLVKKRRKENPQYDPLPWTRAESCILLLVFAITAVLGQQPLPHDIANYLLREGPSKLFILFYQGTYDQSLYLTLSIGWLSGILLVVAICFFALILISFIQKKSAVFSLAMSLLFAISGYLALMFSIQ